MSTRQHAPRVDAHELALLYLYRVMSPSFRLVVDQLVWKSFLTPASVGDEAEKGQREKTELRALKAGSLGADALFDFKVYWQDNGAAKAVTR
jgi:hypothetical protein